MPEYIEVVFRAITSYGMLLIGARILGKQAISKMTMFDFVAVISLGAIAANLAFNTSIKALHTMIAFSTYIIIIFIAALISLKSRKGRKLLAGDPTVIIEQGQILEKNMNKMRYTIDYLSQQLREKNVFNIEEVLYAIVETNGTLTVLKKPEFRNVTRQDLKIPVAPEFNLPIELIMEGKVLTENLEQNNLTEPWLNSELIKRNLVKKNVLYAVLSAKGTMYVNTYENHIDSPMDKE